MKRMHTFVACAIILAVLLKLTSNQFGADVRDFINAVVVSVPGAAITYGLLNKKNEEEK